MITKIKSNQRDNVLEIRWALNNVCNYKCRYCFPGSNEGNFRSPDDLDLVIKNFNFMLDSYKSKLGKDTFHLKILGGEPTLWKELAEFIQGIKSEHDVYCSIVSNGARTLRWWKENAYLLDNVILSYHQQYADIDHIIEVADTIYSAGKKVTMHVLMDDQHWDKCVNSVEYMKQQSQCHWMIQAKELVSTPNNIVQYTDKQRQYLQQELKRYPTFIWLLKNIKLLFNGAFRPFESIYFDQDGKKKYASSQYYIATEQNRFKGWTCNIGLETIYIDYSGDLMGSCGHRVFDNNNSNILSENFKDKFKIIPVPVICNLDSCECPPDTHVSKINFVSKVF